MAGHYSPWTFGAAFIAGAAQGPCDGATDRQAPLLLVNQLDPIAVGNIDRFATQRAVLACHNVSSMEFREVVRRRRMVRRYEDRAVPAASITRILAHALRAPSAGFVQGWGFLVLLEPSDRVRFKDAVTPPAHADRWLAANLVAPAIIVVHANKDAYLDRYAQPDKGLERSEMSWPAPYWDIDAGFAAMLMLLSAIDEGLGAAFFGLPDDRIDAYRAAFGVPPQYKPIGAVSIGYPAEPPADISADRKDMGEVVRVGSWDTPFEDATST